MTYLSSFKKVIAKSADGTEIYADAVGDPLNPVIIFIHGFSLSAIVFDEIFNDAKWSKNFYLVSSWAWAWTWTCSHCQSYY